MTNILERISRYKKEEVRQVRRRLRELRSEAQQAPSVRGFRDALVAASSGGYGLIAEIKKASPSRGLIRPDFDPVEIAAAYQRGGAACLSVLTDGPSFQGSTEHLQSVANAVDLPVLRKDFMVDTCQIPEARVAGADCILIIMAMVSDNQAQELEQAADELSMDCLLEVHNAGELDRAMRLETRLIGVNNRNLQTFAVSTDTTLELLPRMPEDVTVVSESGLWTREDLAVLAESGVRCFLVGESLMRQPDPAAAVRELLHQPVARQ
ncbi:MAG: indole-3-glycerol phosphate synthase TrpC [Rhodobacteraceae bacterium]|nr:indole-3-glycerol phosphate synthase TrpC [Paracoccaceae bacterium]